MWLDFTSSGGKKLPYNNGDIDPIEDDYLDDPIPGGYQIYDNAYEFLQDEGA